MPVSSAANSQGIVLRPRSTCGRTSEWSPRLPSGGKTAYASPACRVSRSPATVNRLRLTKVSATPPGAVTAWLTSTAYPPGGIPGRWYSMNVTRVAGAPSVGVSARVVVPALVVSVMSVSLTRC